MNRLFFSIFGAVVISLCQASSIRPAKPNHYFFTPTAYMNKPFELVGSLHESSYSLPYNFQAFGSWADNIGRINFGARYGILDNLSVAAGLAWSFITFDHGGHGIHHAFQPRFGTYLCWGFVTTPNFEAALTPHVQLGDHISAGGDFGMMITPNEFWSVIGEFGFSFDFDDQIPYFNTIWGARVHPPDIPFLSFDCGLDFVESPPERFARRFWPFIDVVFTMKTM